MSKLNDNFLIDLRFTGGDFNTTNTGDLDTIDGLDNLRQAIMNRLITVPGSLAHRPNYGAGVKRFQNALSSLDQQRKLLLTIQEQLEQETRIEEITGISFTQDGVNPGQFTIQLKIKPVGLNELDEEFDPFKQEVV